MIISNEFNAVKDVQRLNCNVIIANYIMKEMTGDKILQQIKNMYPKVKCILSSSNDIKLEDLHKKSIDGFLHTPVIQENLEKVMEDDVEVFIEQDLQLNALFCKYCGGKLGDSDSEVIFCKYCGRKI